MDLKGGIKGRLDKIKEFWGNRTTGQKIQLVLLLVVVLAVIGVSIYYATKVEYSVLFSGMTQEETSQIYSELQKLEVDVQTRGTDTLLVPTKDVSRLRFTLINQGLPETGYAYDIWTSQGSAFGTTDSDKKIVQGYQLEKDIAQTIMAMNKIDNALVKVTMPTQSKFALSSTPTQEAQASVMLTIRRGEELTKKEAQTIRKLVEMSVPSLKPENITIAGNDMELYTDGEYDDIGTADDRLSLQVKMQKMMESQVKNLLTPIYGADNFAVAVSLTLNFDDSRQSSVKYEPPADADNMGIIISQGESVEYSADPDTFAAGNTGLDPNGGQGIYSSGTVPDNASYYKQTNEFNAEVNEMRQEVVKAKGNIDDLQISIIINGEAASEESTAQMITAMAKAIGVGENSVSIVFMPFQYTNDVRAEAERVAQEKAALEAQTTIFTQYLPQILIGAAVLLVIIILLVILISSRNRKRRLAAEAAAAAAEEEERQRLAEEEEAKRRMTTTELDSELEAAFGKQGASETVNQIKAIIDKNPESVAQLLRNWLSDDYGFH